MAKTRLDTLLVERGLFESRSRAAAAVIAGAVTMPGHTRVLKPGQLVADDAPLDLRRGPDYVSRGGVKLANALDRLGLDPAGRRCLDAGASTGGFTDCLLQRGAERVIAVDVGRGLLDWRLREDERVTVLERTNARALEPSALPFRPELIVADLSFISLTKVLPALVDCGAERFDCLAMVKPQFEVGRDLVGRGGVVRDAEHRRWALMAVGATVRALGHPVLGFAPSGLPGPAGNIETFLWTAERGRPGDVGDLEQAARSAEA